MRKSLSKKVINVLNSPIPATPGIDAGIHKTIFPVGEMADAKVGLPNIDSDLPEKEPIPSLAPEDVRDLKTVCSNPAPFDKAVVLKKKEEIKMNQNVENEVVTDVSSTASLEKDSEEKETKIGVNDLVEQKPIQEEPLLTLAEGTVETLTETTVMKDEPPMESEPFAEKMKDTAANTDNHIEDTTVQPKGLDTEDEVKEVVTDVSYTTTSEESIAEEKEAEIGTPDLVEPEPPHEEPTFTLAEKPVETPPAATVVKDDAVNPENSTSEPHVQPKDHESENPVVSKDEPGSKGKLSAPRLNEEDIRAIVSAMLPEITMILKKAIHEEMEAKKSLCQKSKDLMMPEDVIKYTGLGKSVVYRLLQSGAIPSQRSGDGKRAKYLVRKTAVDEFLASSCPVGKAKVRGKSSPAA